MGWEGFCEVNSNVDKKDALFVASPVTCFLVWFDRLMVNLLPRRILWVDVVGSLSLNLVKHNQPLFVDFSAEWILMRLPLIGFKILPSLCFSFLDGYGLWLISCILLFFCSTSSSKQRDLWSLEGLLREAVHWRRFSLSMDSRWLQELFFFF